MDINIFDMILINMVSYMSGVFTGLLIFCKYKDKILIKTRSRDNLSNIANTNNLPPPTVPNYQSCVPLVASAPPLHPREITIKTME